jgi:uncharacterized membrane protein YkoI
MIGIPALFVGAIAMSAGVYAAKGIGRVGDEVQEPSYKGSISVGQAKESDFPGMAKISLEEATQAALARVPASALKSELEDENGYLVYGIEVVSSDRSVTDVKVDAGTGAVLALEQSEQRHHEKEEHEERQNEN